VPAGPHRGLSARRFWTLWTAAFIAWVAALAVAASFDLAAMQAFADPSSRFGKLVQLAGEWPGWLAVAASVTVLIAGRRPDSRLRPLRPLALAIVILAIVQPLLITQGFKHLWGRVRFRDLAPGLAGYTPCFVPAGPGAGLSFPSGHVAMAAVVTPVVFWLARLRGRTAPLVALLFVLLYVLGVAWGRILAGAHYPTDCLFSAGLSFLIAAPLVRCLLTTAV